MVGMASVHSAAGFSERNGYEMMKKERDLWLAGNSHSIVKFSFTWPDGYASTHGDVEHKWFNLRNVFMSDKILDISSKEESPIFVAVGAGHLAGKAGILERLHESGFSVTPL
jgi:uncharacterized protein YbaP (TraB family)